MRDCYAKFYTTLCKKIRNLVNNKKERLTMDNKWIDTELFNFILDHYESYGEMPKAFISGAISGRMNS